MAGFANPRDTAQNPVRRIKARPRQPRSNGANRMQPEETANPRRPAPVQYAAEPAAAPPGGTLAIGDPGSWAILAFSATSLLLGLFNSSAIDANGSAVIIPVAFVLGG